MIHDIDIMSPETDNPIILTDVLADGRLHQVMSFNKISKDGLVSFWIRKDPKRRRSDIHVSQEDCYFVPSFEPLEYENSPGLSITIGKIALIGANKDFAIFPIDGENYIYDVAALKSNAEYDYSADPFEQFDH